MPPFRELFPNPSAAPAAYGPGSFELFPSRPAAATAPAQTDPFAEWRGPAPPEVPETAAASSADPFAEWRGTVTDVAGKQTQLHLNDPSRLPVKPVSAEDFEQPRTWGQTLGNVAIGAAKGVGSTVANIGETMVNAGMIPGQVPAAFNSDLRNPLFQKTDAATTASNTPQRVGKVAEQVAELLVPAGQAGRAAVEAVPTTAKAGAKFQSVLGAARAVPVDITAPGNAALRIQELAESGGTMPRAVTQFIRRVTDPDKAPLAYEEARRFASNISRLSADEYGRLTPVIAREMAGLRVALNKSIADAASNAGKGAEYVQAMNEYAKAMRIRNAISDVAQGAKRAIPYATEAGIGYWLTKQLGNLIEGK